MVPQSYIFYIGQDVARRSEAAKDCETRAVAARPATPSARAAQDDRVDRFLQRLGQALAMFQAHHP